MEPKLFIGNILFVACCLAYLAWWCVAFKPNASAPMMLKGGLFMLTAILGFGALVYIIRGIGEAPAGMISNAVFLAGAAVCYVALLLITYLAMHRVVTTELLLIVFWVAMMLCVVNAMYGGGIIGVVGFWILAAVVVVAAAIGLVCYLVYYGMEPMKAFYDGMVPLILFAVVMGILAVVIKIN